MKVQSYNPVNMQLISSDVTGVDFGQVVRGNHNSTAVVIRPQVESENFSQLALFLQDNASMDNTQFGKFKSATAISGITPGSNYLSDYFTEVAGISDPSGIAAYSGYGLVFNNSTPEYAWLDAGVGATESTLGTQSVNFRFVFEYV